MGMQPILPITVSVKKIKDAARQRNIVTTGVDEPLGPSALSNSVTVFVFMTGTFDLLTVLHWDG